MDSDEEDFSLSGLTQNTFLADPVILGDELSLISSILETENLDFGNYSESTSANTSHAESTNTSNISLISDEELQKMKETRIPLNTKHNTAWAVRVWKEWADERNSKAPADENVQSDICKVSDVELMKRLTGQGVGANVKQAQAFSEADEDKLWTSELLGDHTASVLLNTMVFLIGSGREHRLLKFSLLTLMKSVPVDVWFDCTRNMWGNAAQLSRSEIHISFESSPKVF
jgi:hypothetical protein